MFMSEDQALDAFVEMVIEAAYEYPELSEKELTHYIADLCDSPVDFVMATLVHQILQRL
jgi:hypothetical protein